MGVWFAGHCARLITQINDNFAALLHTPPLNNPCSASVSLGSFLLEEVPRKEGGGVAPYPKTQSTSRIVKRSESKGGNRQEQ